MSGYYYPRAMAQIDVPVASGSLGGVEAAGTTAGDTIPIRVPVRHVTLVSNSHLEADTCAVVLDWSQAGVDPRIISSAVLTVYLWNDDAAARRDAKGDDLRFVGVVKRSKRVGGEGHGMAVDILAHDYTTLFLEAKKFPSDGVPLLTDTISQAWQRICDHTGVINPSNPSEILPTVKALRDRLVFRGSKTFEKRAPSLVIGDATTGRFKALGRVQTKGLKADAWAVWQQTVGMCGLISFIEKDACVVTTATDYYTSSNPPTFVWGENVLSLIEDRDTTLCGRGVCLQSFDPLTGTQIESFFPPIGDPSVIRHKVSAKKANDTAEVLSASDYECFPYPGIPTQAALDAICESVYQVRAHQELEGRIITHEMAIEPESFVVVNTPDGRQQVTVFDLLTLKSGDAIKLVIDRGNWEALGQFTGDASKIDYLVGLGYDKGLARVVVANLNELLSLSPVYIVKRVQTTLDTTDEGGRFEIEITYCSVIQPSGSRAA